MDTPDLESILARRDLAGAEAARAHVGPHSVFLSNHYWRTQDWVERSLVVHMVQDQRGPHLRSLFNDFFRKVLLCRKLTVVQMHKYCLGVAFSIAMHADLLIADEDCQFGHVEERLGLAGLTVMPIMVARCGLTKALDLCLTGKKIDARTALEWNLINRVVPTDRLEAEVQELAAGLSLYPRDGIAIAKVARELMYETMGITRGTLEHYIMHTFQTNRVYEPDEYNAFKERRDQGVKGMAHGKHNLFSALDK